MKVTAALITLACALLVHAEPPAPNNNYLPPQARPSSQYGAPSFGSPASQYSAPSNSYIPPSNQYGPPQNTYNAPSVTTAIFKQPQSQYGAPNVGGNAGGYTNGNGGGYSNGNAGGYSGGNGGYSGGHSGYGNGGYENNEPAKYSFEYNVLDYPSGNDFGHMESRDGDRTVGKYYVLLPDGRKQIVNYEADQNGYRPTITYEDTNSGIGGYNNNAQQNKFNGY